MKITFYPARSLWIFLVILFGWYLTGDIFYTIAIVGLATFEIKRD